MEFLTEALSNASVAVLIANVITLFIKDEKLQKSSKLVKAVLALLNTVALNVFNNKNAK